MNGGIANACSSTFKVCSCHTNLKELSRQRKQVCGKKSQCTTMYKNNSGLIAKTKVSKYKKGLCLTEKLVHKNPLLFLY